MKKYNAIFFDLDGTLIHMPQALFESECYRTEGTFLAPKFGVDASSFCKMLDESIGKMICNDGTKANIERFFEVAVPALHADRETIARAFDDFYKNEFASLVSVTVPNPGAAEIVKEARRLSDRVIVSTLPIFPPSAQKTRLAWVGLKTEDFDLVTDSYNSSFSKPFPAFFKDLLCRYGLCPEKCLVVGNDERDDLAAAYGAGIPAVFLTDCGIRREKYKDLPRKEFTFDGFLNHLKQTENE